MASVVGPLWGRDRRADANRTVAARLPVDRRVSDAYLWALCRPPRDSETIDWVTGRLSGEPLRAIASSDEARTVNAVHHAYRERLGRDATCAEVRHWVESGGNIDRIAPMIAGSSEARRVAQVRELFVAALGRDPLGWDDASLRRWVDSGMSAGEIKGRLARQRPLVGVHYFMWYGRQDTGWGNDATVVADGAPTPLLGKYESDDPVVVDTHIQQMTNAGFDFVIVHINAESPAGWTRAHRFFDRLRGRRLHAAVMLDGLYTRPADAKAMWVDKVRKEFAAHPNYFLFHGKPLVMLFSASVDFAAPDLTLRNVYWTERYDPGTNTFNGLQVLYLHDWPFWGASPPPIVNGVVPVVPGYTDTHLGRDRSMEFPRNNGQMYHEQWRRALALRPELIVVYSWNEYFEQTAIEPTREWGEQYLQWTACYIAQAHSGTAGDC